MDDAAAIRAGMHLHPEIPLIALAVGRTSGSCDWVAFLVELGGGDVRSVHNCPLLEQQLPLCEQDLDRVEHLGRQRVPLQQVIEQLLQEEDARHRAQGQRPPPAPGRLTVGCDDPLERGRQDHFVRFRQELRPAGRAALDGVARVGEGMLLAQGITPATIKITRANIVTFRCNFTTWSEIS